MTRRWGWASALALGVGVLGAVFACGSSDGGGGTTTGSDAGGGDVETDTGSGGGGALGTACDADSDCESGLECLRGGTGLTSWPAHGLCTLKCDATDVKAPAGEATCTAHTPGSHCEKVGSDQGYCLEGCALGPAGITSVATDLSPSKCHGRRDMACEKLLSGAFGCYPTCNDDTACAPSGACDTFGFCTQPPVTGWDRIGKPAKAGSCPAATGAATSEVCTAACTIGVEPTCGFQGPGTKTNAACLRGNASAGVGDRGDCVQLCDCEGQCAPGWGCTALAQKLAAELGRSGVCTEGASTTLPACNDAGADGGDGG